MFMQQALNNHKTLYLQAFAYTLILVELRFCTSKGVVGRRCAYGSSTRC